MSMGGTLISVDLGTKRAAFDFLNALQLVTISNNFGDTKSLATHPATTTHAKLSEEQRADIGVTDGLVRLSIGIESVRDISHDINKALDTVSRHG
jgi:O-succinylhomoserine sulfhydrylase